MKSYTVFYYLGGWANFQVKEVLGTFSKEQVSDEIKTLKGQGFPAVAIETGLVARIGRPASAVDYSDDKARREAWTVISAAI